ncbi:hypothetical protein GCM10010270_02520 [Streptomyces violaceus]|nr:hypothetical protein GCM10010270_02520 [Streptomyces janthinus]
MQDLALVVFRETLEPLDALGRRSEPLGRLARRPGVESGPFWSSGCARDLYLLRRPSLKLPPNRHGTTAPYGAPPITPANQPS